MTTTIEVPADRWLTDLRPGDLIRALDGYPVGLPRTIEAVGVATQCENRAIRLVNHLGSPTLHHLYPDSHDTLTVERDDITEPAVVAVTPEQAEPSPFLDDYPAYARERVAFDRTSPALPSARDAGTIDQRVPLTAHLRDKARHGVALRSGDQDPTFVRRVLRNRSYVWALQQLADRPNGYWDLGTISNPEDRRGPGTTLGFMARYGWCIQIGTAPARWQITQAGLDVILAWEAERQQR